MRCQDAVVPFEVPSFELSSDWCSPLVYVLMGDGVSPLIMG